MTIEYDVIELNPRDSLNQWRTKLQALGAQEWSVVGSATNTDASIGGYTETKWTRLILSRPAAQAARSMTG